jgi:hypothetical protein
MIDCVWFNDFICVHRNGDVERIIKGDCAQGKAGDRVFVPNNKNCRDGYNHLKINDDKLILRHRLVAHCFQNLKLADRKAKVDHIDRNPLNNSNENLRIVTNQQNTFNTAARGTTYKARLNKWEAKIAINGKTIYLGVFPTEAEAHQAYLDAKLIYHVI